MHAFIIENGDDLSEHLVEYYTNTRFSSTNDIWPPKQLKQFFQLEMIQHTADNSKKDTQEQITEARRTDQLERVVLPPSPGNANVNPEYIPVTLGQCMDLLEQPEQLRTMLIEGPPGIGKSEILKEISYQWAKYKVLKNCKFLFLLNLRDPKIQQLQNLSNLIHLFWHLNTSENVLAKNGGKSVAILLDGFDELLEELQSNSFIFNILNRTVLPGCVIIVSSRPHASTHLRPDAIRIEVLGFSKQCQASLIQKSLTAQQQRDLQAYLRKHPSINSLLLVPFNMTVLLFLYKQQQQGSVILPTGCTEFYNLFICQIIRSNLARSGISLQPVKDFHQFPPPYNDILRELSKLAFDSLNEAEHVFTLQKIKAECPGLLKISGAINGFGLLEAIEHVGISGKVASFNFLHLSVQEYLAADYVTQLSLYSQFTIIKERFWKGSFSNMLKFYTNIAFSKGEPQALRWLLSGKNICNHRAIALFSHFKIIPSLMYHVSIYTPINAYLFSKILNPCFRFMSKPFLKTATCTTISLSNFFTRLLFKSTSNDEITIAEEFLEDKVKCVFLYRCFKEAGDDRMCQSIETAFSREINFANTKLSLTDMECVTFFLTHSSNRDWVILNFIGCHIKDQGLGILHNGLQGGTVRIRELTLGYNGLTTSSSSLVSNIVISCGVDDLSVGGDDKAVGETDDFYSTIIAHPQAKLEKLSLGKNKVTSKSAITLFQLMKEGKSKLEMLYINNNDITDEAVETITAALKVNKTLQVLKLEQNKISGEGAEHIVKAIECNNTLQKLVLSAYPKDIEQKITSLKDIINEKRKGRGCQVELEILFLNF